MKYITYASIIIFSLYLALFGPKAKAPDSCVMETGHWCRPAP